MASAFASGSRRSRLLGAAAALLASCGPLEVDPGADFGVRVLGPAPVSAVGRISVPVHVAVTGCASFTAAVNAGAGSYPVSVARDGDGWVADVPVALVRGQDATCLRGAHAAVSRLARLEVTCSDAGRTASAPFEISYATADVSYNLDWTGNVGYELRYLFRSGDPLRPDTLSPSWLQGVAALDEGAPGWFGVPFSVDVTWQSSDPQSRPRFLATPAGIFLTAGCADASSCPGIEIAPGVVAPTEKIWALTQDPSTGRFASSFAMVPQHVTDLAVAPDGALVVVSHTSESALGIGSPYYYRYDTIVSRVAAAPGGGFGVTEVVGYFPTDRVLTRLSRTPDGRLAFLTGTHLIYFAENETPVLNVTDGHTIERTLDVAAGFEDVRPVQTPGGISLSPDASLILAGSALGPPVGGAWTGLAPDHVSFVFGDGAGAVWGPRAVGTWTGVALGEQAQRDEGILEVFDLLPPNARLFRYDLAPLPGSNGPAVLHGVVAVGERFVLTTNTGVRVLDRDGKLVAGSDPLPCLMTPSAVAIQSGPDQAAVGVGDHGVLVFDLSKL